jgi:hypothetical protein
MKTWKYKNNLIISSITILLVLSACADISTPSKTPSLASLVIPESNLTSTPTIHPSSALPSRIIPTRIIFLSETEAHDASLKSIDGTATTVPSYSDTPFSDPNCAYRARDPSNISPDGNWLFCSGQDLLVISRMNKRWIYSMADFFGDSGWNYDLKIIFWTMDGNYLFFAPNHVMDYGDSTYHYELYFALLRLDLSTGEVYAILPLENGFDTYYMVSISPTGRRLAYSYHQVITVRDLRTGSEYNWPEYYSHAGDFSWSTDGTELYYEVLGPGGIYSKKVDVQNLALPVIYAIKPEATSTPVVEGVP